MPPLSNYSDSLHGRFTGSILVFCLASWPGIANGSELEDPPERPAAHQLDLLAIAPEGGTQVTPAFTPAEAQGLIGMPVPWQIAQAVPPSGTPAETGASSYPAMPATGGLWVTVWVPYGTPIPDTSGVAVAPTTPWVPPVIVPPSSTPYGSASDAWPGGTAVAYPAPGVVPWGSPYGMAPGSYGMVPSPYGLAPNTYGIAPNPYGYGAVPQLSPVLPPVGQPLSIPPWPTGVAAAPSLPALAGGGQASSPPLGPGTYSPPSNSGISPPLTSQASGLEAAPLAPGIAIAPLLPEPNLNVQGLYVLQGDSSSARARLSGDAFLTPNLLVGGALDLATGPDLTSQDGLQLTELYLATAVSGVPGLRFRLGQLDLTSYFDRNSFSKDISRDFFNSTFLTNPALIAGANVASSHLGGLMQWAITDDIAFNAAVFSSSPDITDFALDGFAGEVDFRTGDLILRGTFVTARDTEFQGTGGRLDSYGLNAEWFIPQANLGFFGRYGYLNNSSSGFSEDNFSLGLNVLDIFMEDDRLGLAYGSSLSTTVPEGVSPDVLELFYDFEVMSHLRLGFTFQQRDQFQESYAGFRIRTDWNLLPGRSLE